MEQGCDEHGADSLSERIYLDALRTKYRLENWSDDELWQYCGIYDRKDIA